MDYYKNKNKYLMAIILMIAAFVFSVVSIAIRTPYYISQPVLITITVNQVGMGILIMIFGACALGSYGEQKKSMDIFGTLIVLTFVLLFLNTQAWLADDVKASFANSEVPVEISEKVIRLNMVINYIGSAVCLALNVILLTVYWHALKSLSGVKNKTMTVITKIIDYGCIIFCIIVISNYWTELLFIIDENGKYQTCTEDYTYYLAYIHPAIVLISGLYISLKNDLSTNRKIPMVVNNLIPIIAIVISFFYSEVSIIYIACVVDLIFMFCYLHVANARMLSERRIASMASQLQPHFLYNTLTAIMNIKGNPPETKEAIAEFGKYLRGNLDVLNRVEPIPFARELEHVKRYIELEQLRFRDKVKVEYAVTCTTFLVPALSVQMLVENAIKHGISCTEEGGTIIIKTFEDYLYYYVQVSDDGKGFDKNEKKHDGRSHVGIQNVSTRVEELVNGTVIIDSVAGYGTLATIKIPKTGRPKQRK